MNRKYIIYDGRAIHGTEEACVFDTADSMKEAKEASRLHGSCCIYSYRLKNNELVDERFEEFCP